MIPAQELRKRQEAVRLFQEKKRIRKIRQQIDKKMRIAHKQKTNFYIVLHLEPYEVFPAVIEQELREKGYEIQIFESERWDQDTRVFINY